MGDNETSEDAPSRDWLEQARFYEQPFTIAFDGDVYSVTVEKLKED